MGLILACGLLWISLNSFKCLTTHSLGTYAFPQHRVPQFHSILGGKGLLVLKTPEILVTSALLIGIRKAVLWYEGTLFVLQSSELHLSLEMLMSWFYLSYFSSAAFCLS